MSSPVARSVLVTPEPSEPNTSGASLVTLPVRPMSISMFKNIFSPPSQRKSFLISLFNEFYPDTKENALRYAVVNDDLSSVSDILSLEHVNINYRDSVSGKTVLHEAYAKGNTEIITLLITLGADETIMDNDGKLPKDFSPGQTLIGRLNMYDPKKDIFCHHCESNQKFTIIINNLKNIFSNSGTCTFQPKERVEQRFQYLAGTSLPGIESNIFSLNLLIDKLIKEALKPEEKQRLYDFLIMQAEQFGRAISVNIDNPTYIETARPIRVINLLNEKAKSIGLITSLSEGPTLFGDIPASHDTSIPSCSSIPSSEPKPPAT